MAMKRVYASAEPFANVLALTARWRSTSDFGSNYFFLQ